MRGQQSVYFARCLSPWGTPMGAIKIGCSYGHELRLRAIATNQPYSMELLALVPGGMVTEALVHMHLRKHRIAGEFFHENAYVADYVEAVAERGTAFYWMEAAPQGDSLPIGAFDAFLKYHGITIEAVCDFLGRDPKTVIPKLPNLTNRKVIAAAILLARNADTHGRFVRWPLDSIHGLLGQVHPNVRPLLEAPQEQREAA